MKLTFIGADHEVTGSCHYMEIGEKRLLVDYGMEQGIDIFENQEVPVSPSLIDFVLLTHAHIDHSGMLPLLYKQGFRGQVYATQATCDLCRIMLKDSAHIQEFEAEWKNRKARRSGQEQVEPVYNMDDACGLLDHLTACEYDQILELAEGVRVRFTDVGHLLGSASIEVWATEKNITKKIVFSGDIGNLNQPLIKDPKYVKEADYVVMESTYGDRSHGEVPDYVGALTQILQETFDRGGNVVIPSFAVGRTQEILYFLRKIKADGLVKGHEHFEVYVDSPLAIEATGIFQKNISCCFDEEAMELVEQGINPISFPGLKTAVSAEESKAINFDAAPKVIISASGMCDAGRIRHHLKHNLWRPECSVVFVGYQSVGTLGRSLLEGVPAVKLFGETIEVCARILRLPGISGHADREGLIRWLEEISPKPRHVFVVHGEDRVCDSFCRLIQEEYGQNASAPYSGAEFDVVSGVYVKQGSMKRVAAAKPASVHAASVFSRLLAAGKRLMEVIYHNEGGANKDLTKFTNQILALCEKWDR